MSIDMSQFFQVFFDESAEHLETMEHLLLQLDVESPDNEELNAIFRAAHSIKGGSGTFGFTDMTAVTHVLENLLDRLRKGEMNLRTEMIDAFLEAVDVLKEQLNCHVSGTDSDPESAEVISDKLRLLTVDPAKNDVSESSFSTSYQIKIRPDQAFLARNDAESQLIESLSSLGEVVVKSRPSPEHLTQDGTLYEWILGLRTDASQDSIQELMEFVADPQTFEISQQTSLVNEDDAYGFFEPILDSSSLSNDDGYGFFEPIATTTDSSDDGDGYGFFTDIAPDIQKTAMVEEDGYGFFTDLPNSVVSDASSTQSLAVTKVSVKSENLPARSPGRRAEDQVSATSGRRASDKPATVAESSSIRVSIERVDQLINLVGELVITQAMLAQTASVVDPVVYESLLSGLSQLERNTRDLQESVMSIRMMPISFVFSRFPRVVRDLASKLGKQVELVTVGENTELDKGLIEKIADPLTHLVRNSLDHGIETPEKRVAAGKSAKGTITLSASHQGGNILIQVTDDGAGLNRERILSKASERGFNVNENMPDSEVWMLIFEAGFSTAEVITDVSGRGVGMDVVKRNIADMGGIVNIASTQGQGSTITIRLPLTLAILDGMSVSLGESIYVIPLNLIVETLQPQLQDIKTVAGQGRMVHVRGEYLPIISLSNLFNQVTSITEPTQGVLVLIESEGKKSALFVDALVGQQQVVIKSLETNFKKIHGVSGATIMGDGRVALILDVPAIIQMGQVNA